jgi:hypothetical protein
MKQMGAGTQYMEQFALQTQDRLEFSNSLENPEKAVVLPMRAKLWVGKMLWVCGKQVNVFRPE